MSTASDRIAGRRSTLSFKEQCRVATTANITLSGYQTIDGVTLAARDTNLRVLVKNQTDSSENGIWVARATAWVRATDFDNNDDVRSGTQVYVVGGSAGTGTYYVSSADPIYIATSALTFARVLDPLGTMSTQNANAVAITGGTVNGVSIGATTRAAYANIGRTELSGGKTYSGASSSSNSFMWMGGTSITGTASVAPANGITSPFNLYIGGDSVDTTTSGNGNLIGFSFEHAVSATHTGGRTAIQGYLPIVGAPSVAAGSDGYVGVQGMARASANFGGTTGVYTNYKGNVFGGNSNVWATAAGTFLEHIVSQEFDVSIQTGASAANKYGISIIKGSIDRVRGVYDDAAISINDQYNPSSPGWKIGLAFGGYGHQWAFASDSTLIGVQLAQAGPTSGDPAVADLGVDFTNATFTTAAFASTGFKVDGSGRVSLTVRGSYANDAAAAAGSVAVGELYRNGSVLMIRVS